MGGTYYTAPAPGEPAFVKEGDKVTKGQTVGIIEAMKLMNEIEVHMSSWSFQLCRGHMCLSQTAWQFRHMACADAVVHNDLTITLLTLILCMQAETSGTVSKMLVENGTPVTPGQPLLVIKS